MNKASGANASDASSIMGLLREAGEHLARRRFDLAVDSATRAIRLDAGRPEPYVIRAEAFRKLNRHERALADITLAIRLGPDRPASYVIRAEILAKRCQFDQAIADASQALFIDPNNSAAFSIRASCRRSIGDLEGAASDQEELFRIDPTRPMSVTDVGNEPNVLDMTDERHRKRAGRSLQPCDDLFADGKPDRSLNLRRPVGEDAAQTLADLIDYRPEVMARPLTRGRSRRHAPARFPLVLAVLLAGVAVGTAGVVFVCGRQGGKPSAPVGNERRGAGTDVAASGLAAAASAISPAGDTAPTYLVDLPRISLVEQNGWWSDRGELVLGGLSGRPMIRKPLTFDGRHSGHGIYMHAKPSGEASITYRLGKRFELFRSEVVIPEIFPHQGDPRMPLILKVQGDGRTLWRSKPLAKKGDHQPCSVSVEGIDELSLAVECQGPENWGLAAWVEPRLDVTGLDVDHGIRSGRENANRTKPTPRPVVGGKIEIEVGEQRTVIPEGRFDFRYFPDQPISILSTKPLLFTMVVTNQTLLMQGQSFETARPLRVVMEGSHKPGAYDEKYSGINSTYIDGGRGETLAFVHNEMPTGGRGFSGTVRFYATVGLAVSNDRNFRFRKIGPIISDVPVDPNSDQTAQGVCDPSACVDHTGEWLYVYYTDQSRRNPLTGGKRSVITCMARCKVSDGGRPGMWQKYYNGSFSEPGLGGRDSEVADCCMSSVTYIPELKTYIMVGNRDGIVYFTSDDGVHWTKGGRLVNAHDVPVIGEPVAFHAMLHIERAAPKKAVGNLFYAYSPKFGRPKMGNGLTHFLVKRPISLHLKRGD